MDTKKYKLKKEILPIIFIGIIILLTFLFFSYKIETSKGFLYKDEYGQINVDTSAKTISYIVLTILCIYTLLIIIYIKDNKEKLKIEQLFLIVAPVFCILLLLAMPMPKGHDETIHGMRIYEYAEGKFISNGDKAFLEEGVTNALEYRNSYKEIFDTDKTYSTETDVIAWGYRVSTYSPINYLPQVMGIIIGRIFTTNSMVHIYIARLFNIISCIVIMYYAIKIIPYGKNLLFILSCVPITTEGFSTLSADGLVVAASFLWIAYIFRLCNCKEKIGKKEIIILAINAIVISLSKTIYIVLLGLLFFIPKEQWINKKQRILVISCIIILCSILDLGWYFIGIQKEAAIISEKTATTYIKEHPIQYLEKILYTLVENSGKYIDELFGGKLEWNEEITINIFPYILLIVSIFVCSRGEERDKISVFQKFVIIAIIILGIILIFSSMFLGWSNVNSQKIDGIQGRYFLPILPLIFLLCGKKFLDTKDVSFVITNIILVMQIFVIIELVIYHI